MKFYRLELTHNKEVKHQVDVRSLSTVATVLHQCAEHLGPADTLARGVQLVITAVDTHKHMHTYTTIDVIQVHDQRSLLEHLRKTQAIYNIAK